MMNNIPTFIPPVDSSSVKDNDIIQKTKDELDVGSDIVTSAAMAETLLESNKDKAKPENVTIPELPTEMIKDEKIIGEQVKPVQISEATNDVAGLNKRMTDVESRLSSLEQKITTMGTLPDIKQVLEQAEKDKEEGEGEEGEGEEGEEGERKKLLKNSKPPLHPNSQTAINRDFDERLKYLTAINKELLGIIRKLSKN